MIVNSFNIKPFKPPVITYLIPYVIRISLISLNVSTTLVTKVKISKLNCLTILTVDVTILATNSFTKTKAATILDVLVAKTVNSL